MNEGKVARHHHRRCRRRRRQTHHPGAFLDATRYIAIAIAIAIAMHAYPSLSYEQRVLVPHTPRSRQQQSDCYACTHSDCYACMQFISHINAKRSPSLPESSPAVSSPRQNAASPRASSPTQMQSTYHIPLQQSSKARADTSQSLEAPPSALSEEIPTAATTSATAASFSSSNRDRDTFLSASKAPEDFQPQSSHHHHHDSQNYEAVGCLLDDRYAMMACRPTLISCICMHVSHVFICDECLRMYGHSTHMYVCVIYVSTVRVLNQGGKFAQVMCMCIVL